MKKQKAVTFAVPVRLTQERIKRLDELKESIGAQTRADVMRWLIDNAHVRPANVVFPLPDKVQQN